MWFWPVGSKVSPTPLKADEPILSQRPKASAIACRLCWADENRKAYKSAIEEDYAIEGLVTESAILELLRAGKDAELQELIPIGL